MATQKIPNIIGKVSNDDASRSRVFNRFVESLETGKAAHIRLSPGELGKLSANNLWLQALEYAVANKNVHPNAQRWFLNTWSRVGGGLIRKLVGNDDLFFVAMRIMLPSYNGPDVHLYRGQHADHPIGMSWTRSVHIAWKFALYGMANVDPLNLHKARQQPRSDGILLQSRVAREAIMCAPCLLGHKEGEYIVDPRGLEYKTSAVAESIVGVKSTTAHEFHTTGSVSP